MPIKKKTVKKAVKSAVKNASRGAKDVVKTGVSATKKVVTSKKGQRVLKSLGHAALGTTGAQLGSTIKKKLKVRKKK